MKVALFVEGSEAPPPPRGERPLDRIWNADLGAALGLPRFDPIVPISKKHLVALDPRNPRMSGAGEDLAQLIARRLRTDAFEAAVVVWDLVPDWNATGEFCRWRETLDLYHFLGESDALPTLWRDAAARRHRELAARTSPGQRARPVRLAPGLVVAACIEPMFEGLLTHDDRAVMRALGLRTPPAGWPRAGWNDRAERHPDANLIGPAVEAMLDLPKDQRPKLAKQVRGDWERNKDGWGELILRRLLADAAARPNVLGHPLCGRLRSSLA
jgi:hypothetical protein